MPDLEQYKARSVQAGQGHLFQWWDVLDEQGQRKLIDMLATIDFEQIQGLVRQHVQEGARGFRYHRLEPVPIVTLPETETERMVLQDAGKEGEALIRRGCVAVVCVAGGQGSRLGYDGPKGCVPISPVRRKSIFQLHAEQIRALNARYATSIPWYIMTSRVNHEATTGFFERHGYFGLPKSDVIFFTQGMLPAVDRRGKIMMDAKDSIFLCPDGHGGTIGALARNGCLRDMALRGIEHVYYMQVDNILIKIADPVFVGLHARRRSDMSFKMLRKTCPEEKLGVIGMVDGRPGVVEYSDLRREDMYARDETGALLHWAGSPAIHVFSRRFLEKAASEELPFHRADKKIAHIDEQGEWVIPDTPNGIKFETFIFDALPMAARWMAMEVVREDEFAPVKNATGVDSIESARAMFVAHAVRMLQAAGISVPCNADGTAARAVEISALYALDPSDLRKRAPLAIDFSRPVYLG